MLLPQLILLKCLLLQTSSITRTLPRPTMLAVVSVLALTDLVAHSLLWLQMMLRLPACRLLSQVHPPRMPSTPSLLTRRRRPLAVSIA